MADSSEAERANPDPVPAQNQGDGDVTDSEDSLMIDSDGEQPSSRGPEARFQRPPGTSYDHSSLDQYDMRLHMENKTPREKRTQISALSSVTCGQWTRVEIPRTSRAPSLTDICPRFLRS